jgi:large subunit ribosomal protein L31e
MSQTKEELERVYTIPLSRAWIAARHRRTKRAVNMIREFAEKHMKSSEIKIDTELNERLWNRGITSPPRRITVRMKRDEDGVVTISLPKEAKVTEPVEDIVKDESPKQEEVATTESQKSEPKKSEEPAKPLPKQPKKSARAKSKS